MASQIVQPLTAGQHAALSEAEQALYRAAELLAQVSDNHHAQQAGSHAQRALLACSLAADPLPEQQVPAGPRIEIDRNLRVCPVCTGLIWWVHELDPSARAVYGAGELWKRYAKCVECEPPPTPHNVVQRWGRT